ncbi:hypothetical protein MBLNU457_6984t1 [Dothideomycetes sp. NU457]
MRFAITLLLIAIIAVLGACAAPVQKPVMVSYPANTPQNVVDQAMDAIKAAGGVITHEFKLIKGFAATAPAKVLATIETMDATYKANVEDDGVVSTKGGF